MNQKKKQKFKHILEKEFLQAFSQLDPNKKVQINGLSKKDCPNQLFYQKVYYCENKLQHQLINKRCLINNHHIPRFQLISNEINFVTVKIYKYQNPGVLTMISKLNNKSQFQKILVQLIQACLQLEIYFGNFKITQDNLKSDSSGNIVIWPNQDFENLNNDQFTTSKFNLLNTNKNASSFTYYLDSLTSILFNHYDQTKPKLYFKEIYNTIYQIKQKLKMENIRVKKNILKEKIQLMEQTRKSVTSPSRTLFKVLKKSDFLPMTQNKFNRLIFQNKNEAVFDFKSKRFSVMDQFSTHMTEFCQNPLFLNKRMSTYNPIANKNNSTKISFMERSQPARKCPQFIKQREKQRNKKLENLNHRNLRKNQENWKNHQIDTNKSQLKQNFKLQNLRQEQSMQIQGEYQNSSQSKQTIQKSFQQLFSIQNSEHHARLLNVKSCNQISNIQAFQIRNKETQSTIQTLNQCFSSKSFFLNNLSLKQEKEIIEDFDKIFKSRRFQNDIFEEFQNQELTKEFLLLIQ